MTRIPIVNLQLGNDTSTIISHSLNVPIKLNPQKRYLLSIKNFQYSNVFANVLSTDYRIFKLTYYFSDTSTLEKTFTLPENTIYSLSQIYAKMKAFGDLSTVPTLGITDTTYLFDVYIDVNDGLSKIAPTSNFLTLMNTHGIDSISFHSADPDSIFRGKFFPCLTGIPAWTKMIQPDIVTSDYAAKYIEYNNYLLTTNLCSSVGYCMKNNNAIRKNFVVSVPNVDAPFEFVNHTAFQPIEAIITGAGTGQLQNIQFQLTTDTEQELVIVNGANTDFGVYCSIVELD